MSAIIALMICGRRALMVACLLGMVWMPQFIREFVLSLIVLLLAEATSQTFNLSARRQEPDEDETLVDTLYSSEEAK